MSVVRFHFSASEIFNINKGLAIITVSPFFLKIYDCSGFVLVLLSEILVLFLCSQFQITIAYDIVPLKDCPGLVA